MLPLAKARHGHQLNSEDHTADVIQISTHFPQCPLSIPRPHNAFNSTYPLSPSTWNNPCLSPFWHLWRMTPLLHSISLNCIDSRFFSWLDWAYALDTRNQEYFAPIMFAAPGDTSTNVDSPPDRAPTRDRRQRPAPLPNGSSDAISQ